MPSSWITALKEWNSQKGGSWCVPKKGSAEYEEVRKLMGKGKSEAAPAAAEAPKRRITIKKEEIKMEAPQMEGAPIIKKRRITPEMKAAREAVKKEVVKKFLERAALKKRGKKMLEETKKEDNPLYLIQRILAELDFHINDYEATKDFSGGVIKEALAPKVRKLLGTQRKEYEIDVEYDDKELEVLVRSNPPQIYILKENLPLGEFRNRIKTIASQSNEIPSADFKKMADSLVAELKAKQGAKATARSELLKATLKKFVSKKKAEKEIRTKEVGRKVLEMPELAKEPAKAVALKIPDSFFTPFFKISNNLVFEYNSKIIYPTYKTRPASEYPGIKYTNRAAILQNIYFGVYLVLTAFDQYKNKQPPPNEDGFKVGFNNPDIAQVIKEDENFAGISPEKVLGKAYGKDLYDNNRYANFFYLGISYEVEEKKEGKWIAGKCDRARIELAIRHPNEEDYETYITISLLRDHEEIARNKGYAIQLGYLVLGGKADDADLENYYEREFRKNLPKQEWLIAYAIKKGVALK